MLSLIRRLPEDSSVTRTHKRYVKIIARIGYCAKFVVYSVLGFLTIYAVFFAGNTDNISKKTVFQEILQSPFGQFSLASIIIGFACYVVWRSVQAITNPDDLDMSKPSNVFLRVFYLGSALLYTTATYAALQVLLRQASSSEQNRESTLVFLLESGWGTALIVGLGLVVISFGLIQFKHALKADFMDKFVPDMPGKLVKVAKISGRFGFAGRGVLYSLIGGFFLFAAHQSEPSEVGGMGKAISTLLLLPFGPYLASALGAGMIAFGIFCGLEGRYRKTH